MARTSPVIVGALVTLIAGACGTGPEYTRVMGQIQLRDQPVEAIVPPEWVEGHEFRVLVTTYGGCQMERGDTEVSLDGLRAVVTPYDLVEIDPESPNCPSFEVVWTHTGGVTFHRRGRATVVFRGLRFPDGDTVEGERTIQIF